MTEPNIQTGHKIVKNPNWQEADIYRARRKICNQDYTCTVKQVQLVRAGLEPAISVQLTRLRRRLPIKYLSRLNKPGSGSRDAVSRMAVWLSTATTMLCGYAEYVASLFQAPK